MDIGQMKALMCDICMKMWMQGWAAANDGNVSARLDDGRILATPTGISKSLVTPEKLVITDAEGNIIEAADGYRPSSELKMHLRCYRERDDIGAVVHAHPPTATGFAVVNKALDGYITIESVLNTGSVPVAPYASPSTDEVPDSIAPYLSDHDAILLRNHGALTVGSDLISAYYRMESLEQFAKISLTAHLLGGAEDISEENITKLIGLRDKYGLRGRHPGYRKYPDGNK